MRQIVLDTETTGLSTLEGHRIIEIAAVEMINRKLTGNHFHHYINPEREIEKGAENIHGITLEFLKDKPVFANIVTDFLSFVQDAELIIHNAVFDTEFINYELGLLNEKLSKIDEYCKVFDTLVLARSLHPGQKNNLDALCKRYNVDNSKRNLHGALLDANLLAHVYLAMTGGQGSLFGEEVHTFHALSQEKLITKKMERNFAEKLVVIKATPEEINLHESRLKEIQSLAE